MLLVKPKIEYDCDVLIAGGGPAGSTLAYHLATKGINVMVVEAGKFPRDKVCGDGVSPIALAELDKMGITRTANFARANEIKKVGLFLKGDQVFIDLSKPKHLRHHARIIPRIELDNMIYEAAKNAGASFMQSTRVQKHNITPWAAYTTIKNGKEEKIIKSRVLVGADGGRSIVARQMHGSKPSENYQLLGLRAYYENVEGPTDRVDIYFSEAGFPGIFWMFPNGKRGANIGMALISETFPQKPPHIKKLLTEHIATNPLMAKRIGRGTLIGKMDGWPITFFNTSQKLVANRVLLLGEAAGLINPLSGDGIQYALLSASWAAETLENCLALDEFSQPSLASYAKKVHQEVDFDFALSNLLVQFPRNKTFTKVWMQILSVLIARAKTDKDYADIIAGIFEGTYPSYKALTVPFIMKSLKQGGMEISNSLISNLKNPDTLLDSSSEAIRFTFNLIEELKQDPFAHLQWAKDTLAKTASVAAHVARAADLQTILKPLRT